MNFWKIMYTQIKVLFLIVFCIATQTADAQQIPFELQGVWAKGKADCKKVISQQGDDYDGFNVDKTTVSFALSSCKAKKSSKFDGKVFSSTYVCASEGEENPWSMKISILDPANITVQDKDGIKKYTKCSK